MRRVALIAGLVLLMFGMGNAITQLAAGDVVAHQGPYRLVGLLTDVLAILTIVYALAATDRILRLWWAPGAIGLFLAAVTLTPLSLHLVGYPNSGIVTIAYPVITILAFYVLVRWLAALMLLLLVAGHGVVEYASDAPWPVWAVLLFVAGALLAAGFLTGDLIEQLEESRNAEHDAATELADLNANLEAKVAEQVDEVERLGRLRRFLSAPVAEAVLDSIDESRLAPHRREIAVLFCDLRGFTAFTKQVEPEEVMEVLDVYYAAAGEQITKFQATLGSFEGDGLMAYLNDPVPCDEPARRVVEMGLAISDAIDVLTPTWHRRGYDLSYGIGMALGHATLGIVGYDGRSDYTAMGTVVNLGARLCGTAKARELVVDRRVFLQTEDVFTFNRREPVMLKGFGEPVGNYLVDRP
jgi:class 3 adenylate cyclase